jgi:hypothetical protein
MVPTATMLGRLTFTGFAEYSEWAGAVVVMGGIIPDFDPKTEVEVRLAATPLGETHHA